MTILIPEGLDPRFRALPKWPQMIVRGKPVTVDQAKEIIRRTDRSFTSHLSGNDHKTIRKIALKLGMPPGSFTAFDELYDRAADSKIDWGVAWKQARDFRELWGALPTEYVYNNWVSSSFVHGPYGWCHPDGTIEYHYNVGKWPSVESVAKDWDTIATAFPFLDLTVTLLSGENCEDGTEPVVTLKIKDGNVTVCPPEPLSEPVPRRDVAEALLRMGGDIEGRECGIPMEWIDEWGAQHRDKVRVLQEKVNL